MQVKVIVYDSELLVTAYSKADSAEGFRASLDHHRRTQSMCILVVDGIQTCSNHA